jgi:hypothetical protein
MYVKSLLGKAPMIAQRKALQKETKRTKKVKGERSIQRHRDHREFMEEV